MIGSSACRRLKEYGQGLDLDLTDKQCSKLVSRYGSYSKAKTALSRMCRLAEGREQHGIHEGHIRRSRKGTPYLDSKGGFAGSKVTGAAVGFTLTP